MTEIFFYILEDEAANATAYFTCRLTEKAHGEGHRVFIHVADTAQAAALDDMLWQFRQGSFVPHATLEALTTDDDLTPVVIGTGEPPAGFDDVLINAGGEVGLFFRVSLATTKSSGRQPWPRPGANIVFSRTAAIH